MDELQLFCITNVNCPPVELKRTRDGFNYSFVLKEPLPRFMVLFSQGKWLDTAETIQLEASLIVNNNSQKFGFLNQANKSIMKEVNFDSVSKKKIQARLEVKAIGVSSSSLSNDKNGQNEDTLANAKQKTTKIASKSKEKPGMKNSSSFKENDNGQNEMIAKSDSKKITAIPNEGLGGTFQRKDQNLKEVDNLQEPNGMVPREKSPNKNATKIEISKDESTLDKKETDCKTTKKSSANDPKGLTNSKSQIPDLSKKEAKENVPSVITTKRDNQKTKNLNGEGQNSKELNAKKTKSKSITKADDIKKPIEKKTITKGKTLAKRVVNAKKPSVDEVTDGSIPGKNTDEVVKKDVGSDLLLASTRNDADNSVNESTEDDKKNVEEEKGEEKTGRKKKEKSPDKKTTKSKDLVGSKPASKSIKKKDECVPSRSRISQVISVTSMKTEKKVIQRKKTVHKFSISRDMVKTKQTTLPFKSLHSIAEQNKEKSIFKESSTPPNKRKLSVSFDNQVQENGQEGTSLLNDSLQSPTPKRKKLNKANGAKIASKDTQYLIKADSSIDDIEDKNAKPEENHDETLKTPHVKNACKTPSPPKPPQKSKNKKVRFEATPDSGSTPKKRSPKRFRTLKNEFSSKSTNLLNKETSRKHPAICKDVTDRSCHPSERWGPSLSMVGSNKAVLIGGQGEKQVLNKDSVWSLNPETRKWKHLETKSEGPRPDLRMGHTATYDPTVRCIYVYGGSKNLKWFNDVHALDVDEKLWQLVKVTGRAPTRAYHTACLYRHEIWIFGGVYPNPDPQPDGCSNDVHVFSPVMGNWYMPIVNGEKPAARSGHSATLIKEGMVIFGGWDFPYCFNDIYILDLSLVEWSKPETKGSPPKPRSWHASCALSHSRVLIHGGYDGDIALGDIHIFDVATMCWMEILLTSSPVPRAGHTCLCLPFTSANEDDDEVLIFGGGDNEKKFFGDLYSISVPFRPAIKMN